MDSTRTSHLGSQRQGRARFRRTGPLWVGLLVLLSLGIRIALPWQDVVGDEGIRFPGRDPWFYVRMIERWAATFPQHPGADSLALYPEGQAIEVGPLFGFLSALICRAVGLGQPSAGVVEWVSALLPAVLGALCVVPAFVLSKQLFGRSLGLASAFLVSLLPGGFLLRTSLGFVDHHALEALLATTLLAVGLRWAREPSPLRCMAAGFGLGLYLLTWTGGLFLLAGLGGFLVVRCAIDLGRGDASKLYRPTTGLCAAASLVVLAGTMASPASMEALAGLGILAGSSLVMALLTGLRRGKKPSPVVGVGALLGLALIAAASLLGILVGLRSDLLLRIIELADPGRQVGEFAPLLFPAGELDWRPVWQQFGPFPIIAVPALPWLCWRWRRRLASAEIFFVVWTLWTWSATLVANRFVLYAAVPTAVLAAAGAAGIGRRLAQLLAGAWRPRFRRLATRIMLGLLAVASILQCQRTFVPFSGPGPHWVEGLRWLAGNSPPVSRWPAGSTERPGYSVLAWWDAGYWITRIAERAPLANPTQRGATRVARLMLQEDLSSAIRALRESGVRYLMLDDRCLLLPHPGGRYLRGVFPAFAAWSGRQLSEYVEILDIPRNGGGFTPTLVYKPAYFRTLSVRLYLYGGSAKRPLGPVPVVTLDGRASERGVRRAVRRIRTFATYEEAISFVEGQESGQHEIVSFDSFSTCVPLQAFPVTGLRFFEAGDSSLRILELAPP